MYAIVQDGPRQFRAAKGAEVELDFKGATKEGEKVEFNEVLLLHDGKKAKLGTPTVSGAKVVGEIVSDARGPKLRVFKYRRREGYRRALGHRQKYTVVRITDIVSK